MGSAKAAVLPVPVWAMPSRSRPASRAGMARGLDGGGHGVVVAVEGAQQRLGEAEIGKGRIAPLEKKSPAADRAFRARVCRAAFGPFPRAAGTALFRGIVSG